ncbi:MAG TPA: tetratricopeptide repeat protein [Micropepsaceae bacterium]|nr:tetratricopeptide repeat protein [Micropepsaceae bacterium]
MRRIVAAVAFALSFAVAAPASADVFADFKQGQLLVGDGKNAEAVALFTTIIDEGKLTPDWMPFAYYYRGQAQRNLGELSKAIADYEQAVALKADIAPAHYEMGLALSAQKRYRLAIDAYTQAIKLTPDNANFWYARCGAKSLVNDNAGAREDCIKAVQLKPDFVDAIVTLGRAYEDLGQFALALQTYETALLIDPDNRRAREGIDYIKSLESAQ